MKILFASKNAKKTAEVQRMAPKKIEVVCLSDIPEAAGIPQTEENGKTFLDNAVIKARYWHEKLNMPVLAEDSGLEIDALNGYPGVYTKRCVKELCPGANINEDNPGELYPLLLELMEKSDESIKTATWFSAMAYVDQQGQITEKVRYLRGLMCQCAGEREFGFDQYFKPIGYDKTLSQMEPTEKDKLGPRNKALKAILKEIQK